MTAPYLSLIVPVYDEEENLKDLHQAIVNALSTFDFEVIYVNDGSKDSSAQVLEEITKSDSRARIIHFVRNYGQTAALSAGIRHSKAELLVTLDADLQNDPSDIPKMLEQLEHADIVCGWRKDRKDPYFSRTFPSKIANRLISKLSNVHLHDYGCTLRVYRREFIKDIPLYGEMHRFIPIYVTWAGARLIEVPVKHHPRTRGVSKYGLWRIPKVLLDLTTLKFLRDFFVTPIYFFGWLGIFFCLVGFILSSGAIALWTQGLHPELASSLTTLGPTLFGLGLVEITLGIIAEVLIRMNFELQQKEPYRIARVSNLELPKE
jgi:glycosyltransferase involved in cell wall biosynthesis